MDGQEVEIEQTQGFPWIWKVFEAVTDILLHGVLKGGPFIIAASFAPLEGLCR
jgi:hypothetical protein